MCKRRVVIRRACAVTRSAGGDAGPAGLIPRVTTALFEQLAANTAVQHEVSCTFVEIHNETLHDLLGPDSDAGVNIMETTEGELVLTGARVLQVSSATELQQALVKGAGRRATGSTSMNAHSSRSHAVFTIYLEQTSVDDGTDAAADDTQAPTDVLEGCRRSKFHLVDLAGSGALRLRNTPLWACSP